MPLRAFADREKEVIAPFLTDDEWYILEAAVRTKKSVIFLPCCQNTAYLRTSKLGTRHFVHKRKSGCDWVPETVSHLMAKSEIALACKNVGYDVSTEVSGSDWRADVLATKKLIKVAFEVQLSNQTMEDTWERQDRYESDGIRGCWFFSKLPTDSDYANRDLPLFKLLVNTNKEFTVALNGKSFTLSFFVESLLQKRICFCKTMRIKQKQSVRVVFFETKCWKCGKLSHVYYVEEPYASCCGGYEERYDTMWPVEEDEKAEFRSEILSLVEKFLKTDAGKHLKVGAIKSRYSRTVGHSYFSFGCYYCDAIFGDWYVCEESLFARADSNASVICEGMVFVLNPATWNKNHWCFPEDGDFCEG